MTKQWQARQANITASENGGFVVALSVFDSSIMLVARDEAELADIIASVEWRTDAPRPMGDVRDAPTPTTAFGGAGTWTR